LKSLLLRFKRFPNLYIAIAANWLKLKKKLPFT
jgi:hypothetical protein